MRFRPLTHAAIEKRTEAQVEVYIPSEGYLADNLATRRHGRKAVAGITDSLYPSVAGCSLLTCRIVLVQATCRANE